MHDLTIGIVNFYGYDYVKLLIDSIYCFHPDNKFNIIIADNTPEKDSTHTYLSDKKYIDELYRLENDGRINKIFNCKDSRDNSKNDHSVGLAHIFNMCTTEYLLFLDQDVHFLNQAIYKLLDIMVEKNITLMGPQSNKIKTTDNKTIFGLSPICLMLKNSEFNMNNIIGLLGPIMYNKQVLDTAYGLTMYCHYKNKPTHMLYNKGLSRNEFYDIHLKKKSIVSFDKDCKDYFLFHSCYSSRTRLPDNFDKKYPGKDAAYYWSLHATLIQEAYSKNNITYL